MSKPSSTEYARAIELGEQARRAGHKPERNPHKHDRTDRGRLLEEAWNNGFERQDEQRRRR